MKRLLREPLVHFLLIGTALFTAYAWFEPEHDDAPESKQFRLSLAEIAHQVMLFQAQWKREPTPQELARLMESRVQEEVLYREGLLLGLDKEDTIVKRRIAQKMQFLAEDVAAAREPASAELRDWYRQHAEQFALPARYSFRHLYFSPDHRGANTRADAERALSKLLGQPEDTALAETLADPFMFQDYYRDRASEFLGKELGPNFAIAIAQLAPGSWQGPVESGFGWHLVFVDTVIPGRVPDFDEVAPDVKIAWLNAQKASAWETAYKTMRAQYTVLLPAMPDNSASESAQAARPNAPPLPTGPEQAAPP
jgi:peptidyl-prolyl cis-trans isomerase C